MPITGVGFQSDAGTTAGVDIDGRGRIDCLRAFCAGCLRALPSLPIVFSTGAVSPVAIISLRFLAILFLSTFMPTFLASAAIARLDLSRFSLINPARNLSFHSGDRCRRWAF